MNVKDVFHVIFQNDDIILVRVAHPYDTMNNDNGRIIYSSAGYSIYLFQRSADGAVFFAFPADNIQLAYSPFLGKIVYQDVF
jgi:hypothetical protein